MAKPASQPDRPPLATITVGHVNGGTVVRTEGEIDISVGPELRAAFDALGGTVWVDLSELTFIDSTGIGVFVDTRLRLQDTGGDLHLANPRGAVSRVLEIMGLFGWVRHDFPNGSKSTELDTEPAV
jgi:anti-anti-sigma factor